jgi:hypothetical protein
MVAAYADCADHASSGFKYWIEKTPETEYHTRYVFSAWESPRVIHIVRDPRDVFLSYRKFRKEIRPEKPPISASWFAHRWVRSALSARKNERHYGAKRYLILRYEDLCHNPKEQIQRITTFLSINDHPSLRKPTRSGEKWTGNSMHGVAFSEVTSSSVGRWKENLDIKEVEALEAYLGAEMKRHGYELVSWPSVKGYVWRWGFRMKQAEYWLKRCAKSVLDRVRRRGRSG